MIADVAGELVLPTEVVEAILARTEGVPLFVEELTKTVLESGLLHATGAGTALSGALPQLAIPSTLQDSLMARLDRLAAVKDVAQIGATIGREFSFRLLAAVAGQPPADLRSVLARLVGAGLAFERGSPPDASYTFKHALVQDAAYRSLLRSRRRQLHGQIATVLEADYPQTAIAEPELLAHHFTEAGLVERALEHWFRAGELAIGRSANHEAISHLSHALECLARLPASLERDRRELAVRNAIGGPLIAVRGYAAPEVGEAFSRARVLCEQLGETRPLFAALSGEFVHHFVRADHNEMRTLAAHAKSLADQSEDSVIDLAQHRMHAIAAMQAGCFSEARREFERILDLYDADQHRPPPVHLIHDPKISALTYLAPVLWILGFPQQARLRSEAAFRFAGELNQVNLTAHVRVYAGAGLGELLGDVALVREHADAIVDISQKHGLRYWVLNGQILRGWVLAQDGDATGIEQMRRSATERAAMAVGWYQIRYLCMLAETHLQLRQHEAGLQIIAEAEDLMTANEDWMWEAELSRVKTELRRPDAQAADVEAGFDRAIAVARRQEAKAFELRAATGLGRYLGDRGRTNEACAQLAPVYGWFTEGLDTPDLEAARLLLANLR